MRNYKFKRKVGIVCLCDPLIVPRIVNHLVLCRVYEYKSMKHGNIYIGNHRRPGVHKVGTWNDLKEGTLCAFDDDEVISFIYK